MTTNGVIIFNLLYFLDDHIDEEVDRADEDKIEEEVEYENEVRKRAALNDELQQLSMFCSLNFIKSLL